jgi:prepilin-type N-terminal cleavage/methylation domain-containing protein
MKYIKQRKNILMHLKDFLRGYTSIIHHPSSLTQKRGFSLIEMMVAVALFAVVMIVSTGALLALIDATRKAQALQSVMNNLNIALDGMVRNIRMGHAYHCGNLGTRTDPRDCPNGDVLFAFEAFGGKTNLANDQRVYWFDPVTKRIYKSVDGGSTGFAITAPEVQIEDMKFYVFGTTVADDKQPKVVITVRGTAGAEKIKTRTTFSIQATATQRVLDL